MLLALLCLCLERQLLAQYDVRKRADGGLDLVGSGPAKPGSGGFVIGKDHAYLLEAPKRWLMDPADAAKNKVGAVFHPVNAHWPESNVIVYTDMLKKTKALQTPADAM